MSRQAERFLSLLKPIKISPFACGFVSADAPVSEAAAVVSPHAVSEGTMGVGVTH